MKKKSKVLLVDDDKVILEMYTNKLKREGLDVLDAMTGPEALKFIEKEKIDIAVIDIVMPKKSGLWLLKKIKTNSNKDIKKIPVIMLTNLNDSRNRAEAAKLGCLYYFLKSEYTPAQLADRVKEVLLAVKK